MSKSVKEYDRKYMSTPKDSTAEFMEAYDKWSDAIFRHCYFRVYDRERARDLTQDAFTKTWACIQKGQEIENMRAFLYKVATNLIIDSTRKKSTTSLDELMACGFEPMSTGEESIMTEAETSLMLEHLEKLPEKYKNILTLRFLEGLSPPEIAEITGIKENAISVRIHRATKKLSAYMN